MKNIRLTVWIGIMCGWLAAGMLQAGTRPDNARPAEEDGSRLWLPVMRPVEGAEVEVIYKGKVSPTIACLLYTSYTPGVKRMIMVGTLKSRYIRELVKAKKIDASLLEGKNEKYLMTVVSAPLNGVNEALVIAGSDKRGTIYGIYELSEQIGVSPW